MDNQTSKNKFNNDYTPLSELNLSEKAISLLNTNKIITLEQLLTTKYTDIKGVSTLSDNDKKRIKNMSAPDADSIEEITIEHKQRKSNKNANLRFRHKDDPRRNRLRFNSSNPTKQDVLEWIKNRVSTYEWNLNLFIPTPVEAFYLNPNYETFRKIPKIEQTYGDVILALSIDPNCFRLVSKSMLNDNLCIPMLKRFPEYIEYIPKNRLTRNMCETALLQNPLLKDSIPTDVLDSSITSINANANQVDDYFSTVDIESYLPEYHYAQHNYALPETLNPKEVETPNYYKQNNPSTDILEINNTGKLTTIDNTISPGTRIYYISDIHIEHQLQASLEHSNTSKDLRVLIINKIQNMICPSQENDILLIAGDTADSPAFIDSFIKYFSFRWRGTILFVLGNHELWRNPSKNIDDTIQMYSEVINNRNNNNHNRIIGLLENALYLRYKNQKDVIIDEKNIIATSSKDLSKAISNSTVVILGGIGFSKYDACDIDWYNGTISHDTINIRTQRFLDVYNKVKKCSGKKRVVVLTHFPFSNWNPSKNQNGFPSYEDDWIYVSGHTHNNTAFRSKNNSWIFSNNQIGYKLKNWELKSFLITDWYDSFSGYSDGIYNISNQQYIEFNFGRGIMCNGCGYSGQIIMLKRCGIYMFILKTDKSICLLDGGKRKRLTKEIEYYYKYMYEYAEKIHSIVTPYHKLLKQIASEVKQFGGIGIAHGCIVDISQTCHIHIDPETGESKIYYEPFGFEALFNTRQVYDNVSQLLLDHETSIFGNYFELRNAGNLKLIEDINNSKLTIGEMHVESGTDFRSLSPSFRKMQYLLENDVIRIWEDDILSIDNSQNTDYIESTLLPETTHSHNSKHTNSILR